MFWGGGFVLPLSVLALGWVMQEMRGKAGLGLAIVLLVVDGVGLMVRSSSASANLADGDGKVRTYA